MVATLFSKEKAKWLNILHAGWPAGLALGALTSIALGDADWKIKYAMCFLSVAIYAIMILPRKFPVNERVETKVPYRDMLAQVGAIGFFILTWLLVLLFLSKAAGTVIIVAATVYALGKTFLWSTTLGLVSE